MYIKIGTDSKPLGLKVSGGFTVDTPILKITSYQTQISVYTGTLESSFTKPPTNGYPEKPLVSVSVSYFRTYEDYLNVETPIVFNPSVPVEPEPSSTTLNSNYHNLIIEGEVTLTSIYEALKTKIAENFKVISVVTE